MRVLAKEARSFITTRLGGGFIVPGNRVTGEDSPVGPLPFRDRAEGAKRVSLAQPDESTIGNV